MELRRGSVRDTKELYDLIDRNREHLTNLVWVKSATLQSTWEFLDGVECALETFRLIVVNGKIAGCITLRHGNECDIIGYWLGHEYRGDGIMKEAVAQMIRHWPRAIRAQIREANSASMAILEGAGFMYMGKFLKDDEYWVDLVLYPIYNK